MPIPLTYPGVYIQELPSGSHTLTGVSTSVTAFVGGALRGPTDTATVISSFADFQRTFGGLWKNSPLSYAMRDFFTNGGSQAIMVRVFHPNSDTDSGIAISTDTDKIFMAANPGSWGNQLVAEVNDNVSPQVAAQYGLNVSDLFNLMITDKNTGNVEQFNNLTVKPSPAQVDNVLANQSKLLRIHNMPADTVPAATDYDFNGGNDGTTLTSNNILGSNTNKTGMYALENISVFNLLCIPPYTIGGDVDDSVLADAAAYCFQRRAFYIIDAPSDWKSTDNAVSGVNSVISQVGNSSSNAAIFFPRVQYPDPLNNNQLNTFAPCGMIAGMMANIDNKRGVWKAPAGLETGLAGVTQLSVSLTDSDSGRLNPIAVNCLRTLSGTGSVIWGSRTLQGSDILGSDWKYIPVRRMALYIEQSAYFGTQWAVFEPNDAPLWQQITLSLNGFMNGLFRQGAFQGQTTSDAYFVKCDSETTTQDDINNGIVNVLIGFAPLKPAEFVVVSIQQMAGQN